MRPKTLCFAFAIILFCSCNEKQNQVRLILTNNSPFIESASFRVLHQDSIILVENVLKDLTLHKNFYFEIELTAKKGDEIRFEVESKFEAKINLVSDSVNYICASLFNPSPFIDIADSLQDSLFVNIFTEEEAYGMNYFGRRW